MATNPLRLIRRLVGQRVDDVDFAALARPHDPADYALPELDGSGPKAADIPLDGTADDASWNVWAPRTLDGCREPLAPDAPDLRGVWECYEGSMKGHVERVEQAGNRITITTGGLVHDMFCDGTLENGVDDIAGIDLLAEQNRAGRDQDIERTAHRGDDREYPVQAGQEGLTVFLVEVHHALAVRAGSELVATLELTA